jgi:hypothetical protein
MKLRSILLAGILLGTTTLAMAEEVVDITNLIEEAQNATPEQRFELINEIKDQIATMNEDDRATAIAQVQASRDTMRETRRDQFSGELTDDKIAEIKANMSPEQIEAFDARLQNIGDNGEARRGPPSAEQIADIKANMTPEQIEVFDQRIQERQNSGRPDSIPEGATRPDGVGGRPDSIPAGATRPDGVGRPSGFGRPW